MGYLDSLWNVISFATTAIVVATVITAIYYCVRGFVPVLIRLGNGLWKRRIAVFAQGDNLTNLVTLLNESKLFNRTNIIKITGEDQIEDAEKASVFLVHWPDCQKYIQTILGKKRENTSLIVYAPPDGGPIPPENMNELALRKNVVVNNFRGRLLNDIVISMITTGYEKS